MEIDLETLKKNITQIVHSGGGVTVYHSQVIAEAIIKLLKDEEVIKLDPDKEQE